MVIGHKLASPLKFRDKSVKSTVKWGSEEFAMTKSYRNDWETG